MLPTDQPETRGALIDRWNDTLSALIGGATPEATAVLSVDGGAVSYRQLAGVVERIGGQLSTLGVGRADPVAVIMPNGPAAALVTLGTATCAAVAPLKPSLARHELELLLQKLEPALIVCPPGMQIESAGDTPVATVHGDLADLHLQRDGVTVKAVDAARPDPTDTALILHTSGTTSLPKQVALTHRNLVTSALSVARALRLTTEDRCLNVMPLFHVHGLVGGLFATVAAGASIVCTPGFDALRVRRLLTTTEATWMTAVPTMYQLILARAKHHGEPLDAHLRFVRSASASMPTPLITDLETMFGAPLIEAYGMTEAAHQISSNPLPPAERRPGSVGLPTDTEVRVVSDDGGDADPGEEGQVLIRGHNVIDAYRNNPAADAVSFVDGWFRTGDIGRLDANGYLYLTGRIKEIINRGGTKISPRQIDEVLLSHPGVSEAACFAVPHQWLGEDVAAVVVADAGADLTEDTLRAHVARFLSQDKVPAVVVFADAIPKGPTGKVQRQHLAAAFRLDRPR